MTQLEHDMDVREEGRREDDISESVGALYSAGWRVTDIAIELAIPEEEVWNCVEIYLKRISEDWPGAVTPYFHYLEVKEEGRRKAKEDSINALHSVGVDVPKIAAILDLTEDEVRKYLQS